MAEKPVTNADRLGGGGAGLSVPTPILRGMLGVGGGPRWLAAIGGAAGGRLVCARIPVAHVAAAGGVRRPGDVPRRCNAAANC